MPEMTSDPLEILYRTEEMQISERDDIGNYRSSFSRLRWNADLHRPVINEMLCRQVPGWLDRVRWPNGHQFAACLTHDMDCMRLNSRRELSRVILAHLRQAESVRDFLRHSYSVVGLRHRQKNVDLITPWIEEEKKHGFHSTFYAFPTRVTQRNPRDCTYRWSDPTWLHGEWTTVAEVIRDIDLQGWEVGLHGSIHSALDSRLLREQKEDIEGILGHPIYTTRQHNLRFEIRQTPLVQEKANFQADTSMGYNREVGFRSGIAYPYRFYDLDRKEYLRLFEIPLVLHDGALLRKDNLGLSEEAAFDVCKRLIDRVAATRGVVTLLWHPNTLLLQGWFSLYKRLLAYISEKNGWGASTKEVYDWWIGQGLDGELERALDALQASREQTARRDSLI